MICDIAQSPLEGLAPSERKVKIAMMAAASLLAAAAALGPVHANEIDPAAYPAVVEVQATPEFAHAAGHVEEQGKPAAQRWAMIAAAAGALAGIIKMLGVKRVAAAVAKTSKRAAQTTVKAAANTARAVGSVMASPMRSVMLFAGLALFALTGVGLYDIEWIGGMAAGLAIAGIGAIGVSRLKKVLKPIRVRTLNGECKINQ